MELKILRPEDTDRILAFENSRLEKQIADETERQFASWQAKWRREALEHYLTLGWSFSAEKSDRTLQGYFIGQPILFFRGYTQVLWVEWLSANENSVREALVDVAYKWARDKHLQKVIFSSEIVGASDFAKIPFEQTQWTTFDLKTTRMNS